MRYLRKIFESPDQIKMKNSDGQEYFIDSANAYCFGYPDFEINVEKIKINNEFYKSLSTYKEKDKDYVFYDSEKNIIVGKNDNHPNIYFSYGNQTTDKGGDIGLVYYNYAGRFWVKEKIISFWEYPETKQKLDEIIKNINDTTVFFVEHVHIDESWNIEIYHEDKDLDLDKETEKWGRYTFDDGYAKYESYFKTEIIKIKDYKKSENPDKEEYRLHLLKGDAKRKALKKLGYKPKHKSDNMIDAEYHDKSTRYRFTEDYTYYNEELNPKFWDDFKLKSRLRKKLLAIATDFYDGTKLEVPIKEIALTGSLANYNYNEFSDFDIHIIIDYSLIYGKRDIIQAGIDSFRISWNNKHNIVIQGHDIEIYIQDIKEPHNASGVYSIMNDEWIKKPEHNLPEIDEKAVDERFRLFKSGINQLLEASLKDLSPELAKTYYQTAFKLKKKIHGERKTDLLTDKAEFSVGNLVFKRLRNSGHFGKLIEVIVTFYDKIYAQ